MSSALKSWLKSNKKKEQNKGKQVSAQSGAQQKKFSQWGTEEVDEVVIDMPDTNNNSDDDDDDVLPVLRPNENFEWKRTDEGGSTNTNVNKIVDKTEDVTKKTALHDLPLKKKVRANVEQNSFVSFEEAIGDVGNSENNISDKRLKNKKKEKSKFHILDSRKDDIILFRASDIWNVVGDWSKLNCVWVEQPVQQ